MVRMMSSMERMTCEAIVSFCQSVDLSRPWSRQQNVVAFSSMIEMSDVAVVGGYEDGSALYYIIFDGCCAAHQSSSRAPKYRENLPHRTVAKHSKQTFHQSSCSHQQQQQQKHPQHHCSAPHPSIEHSRPHRSRSAWARFFRSPIPNHLRNVPTVHRLCRRAARRV